MSVQAIVELAQAFNNVRSYMCEGRTYFSILDALGTVVTGPTKNVWARLRSSDPGLLINAWHNYQFPGARQRDTPVAESRLIVELVLRQRGTIAAREFSQAAADGFLQVLNPSREYIDALTTRADQLASGHVPGSALLLTNKTQTISDRHRQNMDRATTLYIRIRNPKKLLVTSEFDKQLTMSMLKFGIAFSVTDRDSAYLRDVDNGYMAFSFDMTSRQQADIIERILICDFANAAILGSREYIDVATAASILHCDYELDSYVSYVKVAEHLYAYMLKRIHLLWPTYTHMFGHSYAIITDTSALMCVQDKSSIMYRDVGFCCMPIDKARALSMGLIKEQAEERDQPGSSSSLHLTRDTESESSIVYPAQV